MHTLQLDFTYDFDRVLDRLKMDPLHAIDPSNKIVRIPMEQEHIIDVQSIGDTEQPEFRVIGAKSDEEIEHVKRIFHFDRSLEPINEHFAQTNLAELFAEHKGTPIIQDFSLYANLTKSIIHQQLNLSFAHTLTERFVHQFGKQVDGVWFYPTPEKAAQLSVDTLRELQFSTRKAEYIIGVSEKIANGELSLEKLRDATDEDVITTLVKHRGIGPWTAESFLLFGLGRENLFPVADIGLQNALKQLWELEQKPTKEEIQLHFPNWSPYKSYAALYLWRSIEKPVGQ